jgi:hypothetical protein
VGKLFCPLISPENCPIFKATPNSGVCDVKN